LSFSDTLIVRVTAFLVYAYFDTVDIRVAHTMSTSDMELTLDTYMVIPTSTGLPEYMQTQCIEFNYRCTKNEAYS